LTDYTFVEKEEVFFIYLKSGLRRKLFIKKQNDRRKYWWDVGNQAKFPNEFSLLNRESLNHFPHLLSQSRLPRHLFASVLPTVLSLSLPLSALSLLYRRCCYLCSAIALPYLLYHYRLSLCLKVFIIYTFFC